MRQIQQHILQLIQPQAEQTPRWSPMILDRRPIGLGQEQPHQVRPGEGQGQERHQLLDALPVDKVGLFEVEAPRFQREKQHFNGIITNDKFCLTRWTQLDLSWSRRPLRLRD